MASYTNRFFTVRECAQELSVQLTQQLDTTQNSKEHRDIVARPHLLYALERAHAAQMVNPVNAVQARESIESRDAYERFLEGTDCMSDRDVNVRLDAAVLAIKHALAAVRHSREASATV